MNSNKKFLEISSLIIIKGKTAENSLLKVKFSAFKNNEQIKTNVSEIKTQCLHVKR